MSVMGLFFIFIASVAAFWLWRQGVMQSPWLEEGEISKYPDTHLPRPSAEKVGLAVFLAVVGCLFSLLTAAFFMRMDAPDWRMPPLPRILWINTIALAASSVALKTASSAANSREKDRAKSALLAGGATAALFLLGQFWAWRELVGGGFYASENPANAFFFLLTGAHALHLVGGLVALSHATREAWAPGNASLMAKRIALCAIYWNVLLFIWLLQLLLLTGWADNFGAICRRVLS